MNFSEICRCAKKDLTTSTLFSFSASMKKSICSTSESVITKQICYHILQSGVGLGGTINLTLLGFNPTQRWWIMEKPPDNGDYLKDCIKIDTQFFLCPVNRVDTWFFYTQSIAKGHIRVKKNVLLHKYNSASNVMGHIRAKQNVLLGLVSNILIHCLSHISLFMLGEVWTNNVSWMNEEGRN